MPTAKPAAGKTSRNAEEQLQQLTREKQRLSDDLKLFHNLLREKDDEITYLQAYILERGRLRSLLKEFVIKIDSIFKVHLTRYMRTKKRYPVISLGEQEKNPATILQAIQQADKEVFTARPTPLHGLKTGFFAVLFAAYTFLKRLVYRSLRFVVRKVLRR